MPHCDKAQLSVLLNNQCNLKCGYCYVGDTERADPTIVDLDFVKCAIKDFFEKFASRQIRFFGNGEPTLAFTQMQKIRNWVHDITSGNCLFELQTNGYFSKKIADWVAKNITNVWISCDGPPDIQDRYRRTPCGQPTSKIVEGNIRSLAPQVPVLGCRATVGGHNVARQKEMIDYFHSLAIRAVMSDPMFAPVKSNGDAPIQKVDLMEYARHFLEARKYAEQKGVFYGSILSVNFDRATQHFCRACIPYPHLTPDGLVTCCDMACNGDDPKMQDLVYGRYIPSEKRIAYDQEKIRVITTRTADNMPECQDCEVLYNCAGACLGEALNETGSIFGIKKEVCEAIRFLAQHMPLNQGTYPFLHP
ncbi:MAG: SPASM domain-containing protein [Candidatus Peribacteraceae bacterium]|nr:SPASM domain-containing protein [Candidatus Peribacteraceae bacterium]